MNGALVTNDRPLTIGATEWNGAASSFFDGKLDEVQIYNRIA